MVRTHAHVRVLSTDIAFMSRGHDVRYDTKSRRDGRLANVPVPMTAGGGGRTIVGSSHIARCDNRTHVWGLTSDYITAVSVQCQSYSIRPSNQSVQCNNTPSFTESAAAAAAKHKSNRRNGIHQGKCDLDTLFLVGGGGERFKVTVNARSSFRVYFFSNTFSFILYILKWCTRHLNKDT